MTPSERRAGSGFGGMTVCVLLFSGLCSCLREYHFVNKPMFWKEAKGYCKQKFSALANIRNIQDMMQLKEAVGSSFQGKVWIGLHDRSSKWEWSMHDPSFYAPGEYKFRMWHSGEPNNIQAHGRLCVGFREGTWYDLNCNTEFPFVCYDKNLKNSSFGYVLVDQEKSWWGAGNYCKTNHTNLASVRNESENSEIQRLAGDDRFVWIGLFRNTWTLWDGVKSKFKNWISGHPKELKNSCATSVFEANHTGEWMEMKCNTRLPFVCLHTLKIPPLPPEKKLVFHIKISTLESTIDLNDPAVTKALLDRIQEKMGEVGISKDLRVSWMKKSNKKIFNKEKKK